MLKKITETTAMAELGQPYQTKLLRVESGPYAGRQVALMQTSVNEIKLTYSDSPASTWSSLQTVASDAHDGSFDCRMDSNGNIHVVYGEQSTSYLVTRKLTFSGGTWSVGSKVTVYNGTICYDPSLAIETDGTLWVSWSRYVAPSRSIRVKSSTDDGATWGSGPSDGGDIILAGASNAYSLVVIDFNSIHVIYADTLSRLAIRSLPLSGGSWSSEYNIATGSNFSQDFDAAVGADGRLGVVFDNSQMYYREYDGNNWGAVVTLDNDTGFAPQVRFCNNIPVVVYMKLFAGGQAVAWCTDRKSGSFSTPRVLDGKAKPFDAVVLYDASSDGYEDLTSESESGVTADVYHSVSGCLLKDSGDIVYLGMDDRFRYTRFLLSTGGVGGSLLFSYWDGSNWQSFTPQSGSLILSGSSADLLFWTDYGSIPSSWQKCVVVSAYRFWIKIEVDSSYTIGPVASQVSPITEIHRLIFRR